MLINVFPTLDLISSNTKVEIYVIFLIKLINDGRHFSFYKRILDIEQAKSLHQININNISFKYIWIYYDLIPKGLNIKLYFIE